MDYTPDLKYTGNSNKDYSGLYEFQTYKAAH